MRVKIGNRWYDSNQQPICIQISEEEQEQIANMDRQVANKGKYASFPPNCNMSAAEMLKWMSDDSCYEDANRDELQHLRVERLHEEALARGAVNRELRVENEALREALKELLYARTDKAERMANAALRGEGEK